MREHRGQQRSGDDVVVGEQDTHAMGAAEVSAACPP
jgi:hypothetical protein